MPVVRPAIAVFEGISSIPPTPRVIVLADTGCVTPNAVAEKVIFPPPVPDAASASRKLQLASGVAPGALWLVQFPGMPLASSAAVVTT